MHMVTAHWAMEQARKLEVEMETYACEDDMRTPKAWLEVMQEAFKAILPFEEKQDAGESVQAGENILDRI